MERKRRSYYEVVMNGVKWPVEATDLEVDVYSNILDLKFWSPEALLQLRNGLSELAVSMAKEESKTRSGSEKGKLTRFINMKEKQLSSDPPNPEYMLKSIYERILESESCGLLRGFGFCNRFKDPIRGNAEHRSLKSF